MSDISVLLDDIELMIHQNAKNKKFWDSCNGKDVNFFLKQIAMIHSEASEILEAIRKQRPDEVIELEFADLFIRLLDLHAGMRERGYQFNMLLDAVLEKMAINSMRPPMHGVLA